MRRRKEWDWSMLKREKSDTVISKKKKGGGVATRSKGRAVEEGGNFLDAKGSK